MTTPNATTAPTVALTRFAGRAGDHNDRAMVASGYLADVIADRLGAAVTTVGTPEPALSANWDTELRAALPALQSLAARYRDIFARGQVPVTALSRCAVALSTLPVVAAHRPDAVVVWFDAHADLNTPGNTSTGYLGGLAFSGPLGMWDSGLGAGLATRNAVLVGARDLDAPEHALVDNGTVALVPVGPAMADQLSEIIAGRPVYLHIDCDVLDAGIVPTDYLVPCGMTLNQLHACAEVIARSEIVGLEVGELETDEPTSRPAGADGREPARSIVAALEPMLGPFSR